MIPCPEDRVRKSELPYASNRRRVGVLKVADSTFELESISSNLARHLRASREALRNIDLAVSSPVSVRRVSNI